MSTMTAKELALLCETDPKTIRRFIRTTDIIPNCGAGNRYSIDSADAKTIIAAFAASNRPAAKQPTRSVAELRALLEEALEAETLD